MHIDLCRIWHWNCKATETLTFICILLIRDLQQLTLKLMPHNKPLHLQCFATIWTILFCPPSLQVSLPLSPMLTVSHVPSAQLMADIGLKSPTTPMLNLSNRLKHWDFLSLTVDMFASKRNPSHLFSITSGAFQWPKIITRSGLKVKKHVY